MKIIISSGHGLYVRGAAGIIDEVDEARKVVHEVRQRLILAGHECVEFHDDTSTSQSENLNTIVDYHNSQSRHFDVSVHFNAYIPTEGGMGTECLYVSQQDVANRVSQAIAEAGGLINRGPKKRSDLFFLNGTDEPSILVEVCFVDSMVDVEAYRANFEDICQAIADVATAPEEFDTSVLRAKGKCSWFGGPEDVEGVSASEGLAFLYEVEDKPQIFLGEQPANTTGLARRLDPSTYYIAMRWDYDQFPKTVLAGSAMALVRSPKTGKKALAYPADWGPHVDTARVADLSPGLMEHLEIDTDDEVEVTYPA